MKTAVKVLLAANVLLYGATIAVLVAMVVLIANARTARKESEPNKIVSDQ